MISLICLVVAGIFKAVMDSLQFHFFQSIFSKFSQKWWNPQESWKNKWKNGDRSQGEAFPGSSTVFVFLTDAWHFFQHMMIFSIMLAVVLYSKMFGTVADFVILYTSFTGIFEVFFRLFRR